MTKYRKKPVVIEAFQWFGDVRQTEDPEWIVEAIEKSVVKIEGSSNPHSKSPVMHVYTLEGTMTACPGDYIIKGIQGEIYPCKPDIFEATYEPVVESVLLSRVINTYGFTVEQAQRMLANNEIKDILMDNLRTRKGPLRNATVNLTTNIDIDKVMDRFAKKLEEELQKSL